MDNQPYSPEQYANVPERSSMVYEETPPIDTGAPPQEPVAPMKPRTNTASIITALIAFVLLFAVGFWLSGSVRKYLGSFSLPSFGKKASVTPTPTPPVGSGLGIVPTKAPEGTGSAVWNTYEVKSGKTGAVYPGISFMLPTSVIGPTCDGSKCGSHGTYLPGGTRFTVALRGEGQVLPDFRNTVISDLKGVPFPIKETTINGKPATEYTGSFTGTTVDGYVFSQMHGYMFPVTETVSLEINHFTPGGTAADFASDEILFGRIVQSLQIPGGAMEKGGTQTMMPSATPTASLSASVTPTTKPVQEEVCAKNGAAGSMTFSDATKLAQQSACASQGTLLSTRTCNPTAGVWWIDIEKRGSTCRNICEVDVTAKTAKFISNCP